MREADLDLLLENFRAIADERMADLVVTPELKERILRSAAEEPPKGKVRAFPARRVLWGGIAVAAALLVAAVGGSRLLSGGATSETQREIAAESASPSMTFAYGESGEEEAASPDAPVGTFALPQEEEESPMLAAPPPEPEPAPAADTADEDGGGESSSAGTAKGGAKDDAPEKDDAGIAAVGEEDAGDGAWEVDEEAVEEEAEENAAEGFDGAADPEADVMPDFCMLATAPSEGVTAVFTGEVLYAEVLSIRMEDGCTVSVENALPPQSPDQPVMEDALAQAVVPPVYGPGGDRVYVVVTSYRVEQVHAGELAAHVVRVLGTAGTAGSVELVAVAPVQNGTKNGVEIRYDLVADYAAVLVEGDLSAENIARVAGMVGAE